MMSSTVGMKKVLRAVLAAALGMNVLAGAGAGAEAPSGSRDGADFADFDRRARAGERLTVCFFGGSLTWGANASDPNRTGFRGLMADYLRGRYPRARLEFVDASIGGTGSVLGVFRLDRDVLARGPDLVFLDFACNDGGENRDALATCCYEHLLRRMVSRGIPVVQMFFTFRFWAEHGAPYDADDCHPRLVDYRRLVREYSTGAGDVYVDGLIPDLDSGVLGADRKAALDRIWPLDAAHPCDFGYRYLARAGIAGFERAVAEGRVCRVPERPVFGDVRDVRRWNPAAGELPRGWSRRLSLRTSAWYDGLSSRWMDDVAATDGADAADLETEVPANLVAVFGEGGESTLGYELRTDGATVAKDDTRLAIGGNLMVWRPHALEGWERGEAKVRRIGIRPLGDGRGELRVGSVCTAVVVPTEEAVATSRESARRLEALDHARGKAASAAPAPGPGVPVRDGFGVRRNFYLSGRISAKASDIAGVFEVDYVGRQPFSRERFYSANENCTWGRCLTPQVLIDGRRYRLEFGRTEHYPFGYASECTLDGVKLRHQLVLDRNVIFRRIAVVENPAGRDVRALVVQMNPGLEGFRLRMNAARNGLVGERTDGGVTTTVEVGSLNPATLPLNDRPELPLAFGENPAGETRTQALRFDLVESAPGDEHLFWMAFDRTPDEDLSLRRVDAAFAAFAARRAGDASFRTGDARADEALGFTMPLASALEVDGIGAFRASPTYWVWGWDAMVHAGPLAMTGRAPEVRRMLGFFRTVADPAEGILHSYATDFRFAGAGSGAPGGALTMPAPVQLLYVVLLHDYFCLTGDRETLEASLPFAARLVERALAASGADGGLCRGNGFFPDNPYAVGQGRDDVSLINNAIFYQGLCAYAELTGRCGAERDAVGRALVARLWDPAEGLWADSCDGAGRRRAHYPLYGLFAVSPFGEELWPGGPGAAAAKLRSRFLNGSYLAMFAPGSASHLADGNQLGAYYPVTDRTYWNAMNAGGLVEALDDFRTIVSRHWAVLTYPEGQTSDVVNNDPADYSDELGNKQFFAAKGWLADALELNLGLRWGRDGLRFRPLGDGADFEVRNLTVRGGRLSVLRRGRGRRATCTLNGRRLDGPSVRWSELTGDDRIELSCSE